MFFVSSFFFLLLFFSLLPSCEHSKKKKAQIERGVTRGGSTSLFFVLVLEPTGQVGLPGFLSPSIIDYMILFCHRLSEFVPGPCPCPCASLARRTCPSLCSLFCQKGTGYCMRMCPSRKYISSRIRYGLRAWYSCSHLCLASALPPTQQACLLPHWQSPPLSPVEARSKKE